ncbi:MAG: hypothetical protein GX307_04395 [Euryarchaeota archaeon]|nr:hypothetical protein [Euryarchaeota archaeon]
MVGAILVQQTAWENVVKVIDDMKDRGVLDVDVMATMLQEELEEIVRPAGFYRQKSARLQHLAQHIQKNHASDPRKMLRGPTRDVRKELLSLPGIGEETSDAILLFGGGHPKFIAAAYIQRILGRLGILDSNNYGEVQRFVETALPPEPKVYARLYALMVHHARNVCRSRPQCMSCCLRDACESSE